MNKAAHSLIHLESVSKVFYTDEVETHALDKVTLDIFNGEYIAIEGPSGCGKSTLLSILGLLDTPTDGSYTLNNHPVAQLKQAPVAAQRAASEQRPPVPRTPWGDPDLQGLWNYSTNTFLIRHPDFGDREWLTEEEIEAANLKWSTFATSELRSGLTAEYDLSLNFNQAREAEFLTCP